MRKIDWSAIYNPHESDYDKYLRSPEWQDKRQQRLALDNHRCVFCKSTENLNIHHRTYANLGHEDILHDLVTLCEKCHKELHEKIKETREQEQESRKLDFEKYLLHLNDFCELHKNLDYAMGGNVDFLNNDVIREYVQKWLNDRGIEPPGGYIERVKTYFIKLRHETIDELLAEEPGLTIYEIHVITNFNYNFIAKYLKKKGEN